MPTLAAPPGVDLAALLRDADRERFRNPALPHRTRQIAMDGSQKLPQRLLGTVRDRLAARRVDRASGARGRGLDALRERHRRAGQRRSTSPIRWRRRSRRSPRRRAATPRRSPTGFLDLVECSATICRADAASSATP